MTTRIKFHFLITTLVIILSNICCTFSEGKSAPGSSSDTPTKMAASVTPASISSTSMPTIHPGFPTPTPIPSPDSITLTDCLPDENIVDNVIVNGGFELEETGWEVSSSGTGSTWREHALIGNGSSFKAYDGAGAARLGGHEGSSDSIRQRVLIPPGGTLQYWWQIAWPRSNSRLTVSLLSPAETVAIALIVHQDNDQKIEDQWTQDCFDLSLLSGQELILEFHVLNDNYTMTSFGIDEVILGKR